MMPPVRNSLRRLLRKAWRPLGRARRSRGFGVHSPFAFRFITFTLRDNRACYYSTPRLRDLAAGRSDCRRLNRLFRIVCDLHPASAVISKDCGAERDAIRLADSRISLIDPDEAVSTAELPAPTLLYSSRFTAGMLPLATRVLETDGSALCLHSADPEALVALRASLGHAMLFTNGSAVIIVSRHDFPRQDFEINF